MLNVSTLFNVTAVLTICTHIFFIPHIYRKEPSDPSCKRNMKSFTADAPVVTDSGVEWIMLSVTGQSFMLHQIRKMVACTVDVVRGQATPEVPTTYIATITISTACAAGTATIACCCCSSTPMHLLQYLMAINSIDDMKCISVCSLSAYSSGFTDALSSVAAAVCMLPKRDLHSTHFRVDVHYAYNCTLGSV
jgi:tRNA pseudouridine synthase